MNRMIVVKQIETGYLCSVLDDTTEAVERQGAYSEASGVVKFLKSELGVPLRGPNKTKTKRGKRKNGIRNNESK